MQQPRLSHNTQPKSSTFPKPLRAIVEIRGGALLIFPEANNDIEEKIILDALRFVVADGLAR